MKLQFERRIIGIHLLVETIECGSAFRGFLVDELSLLNKVDLFDALSEVSLVNGTTKNGFIDVLQLCEREEVGQQIEAQRLGLDASAQQGDGFADHLVMVGVELRQLAEVGPLQFVLLAQLVVVVVDIDKCAVGH